MPVAASGGLLYRRPYEVDYLFKRSSGLKHSRDAQLFQLSGVLVRNYTADHDQDVVHAFFTQQLQDAWNDRVMRSGKDGQSDELDVFLKCGVHYHLRSLTQAGVNDFHACVAERPRDNLGPPVVTVQTWFGDQNPDGVIHMS